MSNNAIVIVAFIAFIALLTCHEPSREQSFNQAISRCRIDYETTEERDKCREDVLIYYRRLIIDERLREENK